MTDSPKRKCDIQDECTAMYHQAKATWRENVELKQKLAAAESSLAKEREICGVLREALEYYAAMRFNREKMEWMPGNPNKAENAIAREQEMRK